MTIISVVVLMVASSLSRLRIAVYPDLDNRHRLGFMTLPKNMLASIDEATENVDNTLGMAETLKPGSSNRLEAWKKRIARSKAEGQSATHAEAELDEPRHLYRGERLVTETGEAKRKGAFHVFDPEPESRDDFKKRTGLTIERE